MIELISIISRVTWAIYIFAICSGIFILMGVVKGLGELADQNPNQMGMDDITPEHLIVSAVFGVSLIGMNTLAMWTLVSLGAESSYVVDPHSQLGYMSEIPPSDPEVRMGILIATLSRCLGAWALCAGLRQGKNWSHRQEQIRATARLRAVWGVLIGVFFLFPAYFADLVKEDWAIAAYFADLLRSH